MSHQPDSEGARVYAAVPQLARIRSDVLLGDVWKQPELSYRDRILVTCGVLAAGGKLDELKIWMARGVDAGITPDELRGLVVQVTLLCRLARRPVRGQGGAGPARGRREVATPPCMQHPACRPFSRSRPAWR